MFVSELDNLLVDKITSKDIVELCKNKHMLDYFVDNMHKFDDLQIDWSADYSECSSELIGSFIINIEDRDKAYEFISILPHTVVYKVIMDINNRRNYVDFIRNGMYSSAYLRLLDDSNYLKPLPGAIEFMKWLMESENFESYNDILKHTSKSDMLYLTLQGYGLTVTEKINPSFIKYITSYLKEDFLMYNHIYTDILNKFDCDIKQLNEEVLKLWFNVMNTKMNTQSLIKCYSRNPGCHDLLKAYFPTTLEGPFDILKFVELFGPCFGLLQDIFGSDFRLMIDNNLVPLLHEASHYKGYTRSALIKLIEYIKYSREDARELYKMRFNQSALKEGITFLELYKNDYEILSQLSI